MRILNWQKFNENEYTKLATKFMDKMHKSHAFNGPQDPFTIKYCTVQFPDGAIINFDCKENHSKDIDTFELFSRTRGEGNHTDYRGAFLYLDLYGDKIQFEDFREYQMIRYYMNKADLFDTEFDGYIYGHNKLGVTDVKIRITAENISDTPARIFSRNGIISHQVFRNRILELSYQMIKDKPDWRNFFTDHKDETLQKLIDPLDKISLETSDDVTPLDLSIGRVNMCAYIYLYHVLYGFKEKIKDVKDVLNNPNHPVNPEKILGILYEMV